MDALRIEDGRQVMLKKVLPEEGPHKLLITQLFSSPDPGAQAQGGPEEPLCPTA